MLSIPQTFALNIEYLHAPRVSVLIIALGVPEPTYYIYVRLVAADGEVASVYKSFLYNLITFYECFMSFCLVEIFSVSFFRLNNFFLNKVEMLFAISNKQ